MAVITGTPGNDTRIGSNQADTISLGRGDDVGAGLLGNDWLRGQAGADRLSGGDGRDLLVGGAGDDTLLGDSGDDTIIGGDGFDSLFGGTGNDLLRGNDAADLLAGRGGDDFLVAGQGNDSLDGGAGTDTARFFGARADFEIIRNGDGVVFVAAIGPGQGTDALTDVERLQFDDLTLDLTAPVLDLLVTGRGDVDVRLGGGDGSFTEAADVDVGDDRYSIALGDLNGDGFLDLVTAGFFYDGSSSSFVSDVSVRLGNGDGTFVAAADVAVGTFPIAVALGDLDGDGVLDLVTANTGDALSGDNVSVRLGQGDGTFAVPGVPEVGVGDAPNAVVLGDLNGDGVLDLVTANFGDNNLSVRLGQGDGTFTAEADVGVGDGPGSVALGDLNGDGVLDLVTANGDSDNVSIRLGNGDGTFAAAADVDVGSTPISVALGDLDGDGDLDLVTANFGDGNVSVRLGDGDGTFTAASEPEVAVGVGPVSVALGDLDGDGVLDLAVANRNDETVSLRLGNGDGTFEDGGVLAVGDFPQSLALGDLDGPLTPSGLPFLGPDLPLPADLDWVA